MKTHFKYSKEAWTLSHLECAPVHTQYNEKTMRYITTRAEVKRPGPCCKGYLYTANCRENPTQPRSTNAARCIQERPCIWDMTITKWVGIHAMIGMEHIA